jgi:transposase
MEIDTIGIDLGKTVFHLVGLNARGEVVVRRKFSRTQLLRFTSNLCVRLIGMEACGGSHFLGRGLREQGHQVRLIPAQYVKPYVKTNKNDYIDAEAIAEAVGRANMRFVPIKSDDQLDRYIKLGAAGKDQRKVVTAVARELLGFIWAIGTRAETVASQQVAA